MPIWMVQTFVLSTLMTGEVHLNCSSIVLLREAMQHTNSANEVILKQSFSSAEGISCMVFQEKCISKALRFP